jgi:hypothetical protein
MQSTYHNLAVAVSVEETLVLNFIVFQLVSNAASSYAVPTRARQAVSLGSLWTMSSGDLASKL